MKLTIHLVLIALILVLGYMLFKSIEEPILFDKEKTKRYEAVINNLKQIRDLQVAFKQRNGQYCANWDSLIEFAKTDSFRVVLAEGMRPDSIATDAEALALGLIKRDTTLISVKDSLFKNSADLDSLRYVFNSGIEFFLAKDTLPTQSGITVHVFEAKAPNEVILKGMDKQQIINLNAEAEKLKRYPGLQVGSVTEPNNNAGNWE